MRQPYLSVVNSPTLQWHSNFRFLPNRGHCCLSEPSPSSTKRQCLQLGFFCPYSSNPLEISGVCQCSKKLAEFGLNCATACWRSGRWRRFSAAANLKHYLLISAQLIAEPQSAIILRVTGTIDGDLHERSAHARQSCECVKEHWPEIKGRQRSCKPKCNSSRLA